MSELGMGSGAGPAGRSASAVDGGETADGEHRAPAGAEITATWTGPAGPIDYRASAGWTLLRKDDKPAAELFSVAYVAASGPAGEIERPVTFVFNGGPGASSAFLHMGVVGPRRVAFPADGSTPTLPPRLVANEDSWLAFTDLVFIDPIGTGFSRIIEPEKDKDGKAPEGSDPTEYWGAEKDLRSLTEFMGRWLSEHRRWGSPVFIAGESYGGYRAGRLARMAQEDGGIGLNGAILISPALELVTLEPTDYDVVGWVDRIPTMALTAAHHGRSRAFDEAAALEDIVGQAEAFATTDFSTLLTRGASLAVLDRQRIFTRLADLIGLPVELVARAEGRIPIHVFVRELLRDEGRVVGLYDATVTASDPFPDRPNFDGADPTLSGSGPAFTAAVNRQLRGEIGVRTDREYHVLSYDVFTKWKDDAKESYDAPLRGATDDLRYGLSLNPHMRAFITHGRYDLVTPFYATDRLYNLMRLNPATAERVSVRHFGGGHMFYAWEQSRRDFTAAIRDFMADCLGQH